MIASVFEYEEAAPPPELRDVILSFWSFRTTNACPAVLDHTVWPDGCASLGISLLGVVPPFAMCIAPRADARVTPVPRGARFWGVRFWPDTGALVLGVPAGDLADGPVPPPVAPMAAKLVAEFAGASSDADGLKILERWSLAHVIPRAPVDDAVRIALRHIVLHEGRARVTEVADAATMGVRQLQRRFLAATGITVKAFSRVRRLRSALARQMGSSEPMSRTAAEGGYADQAHLAREFSELTGMPPRNVLKHLARIDHRNVRP
jgi:AraC-like DNA-binding protein